MKLHSIVDLITNSSTELFVIDGTDLSVRQIEDLLKDAWKTFREEHSEYKFTGLYDILAVYTASKDDVKELSNFSGINIKKGQKLIEGTNDNSIPWEFFEVIEDVIPRVSRHHLG